MQTQNNDLDSTFRDRSTSGFPLKTRPQRSPLITDEAKSKLFTRKVTIPVIHPFRLDFTVWALKRRLENRVDRWKDETYSRVFMLDDYPLRVAVRQTGTASHSQLEVTLTSPKRLGAAVERKMLFTIQHMLGVQVDLQSFYSLTAKNRMLRDLVKEFCGVKPPRFPSLFEALVNAISCQQLSLTVGMTLMSRFVDEFGQGITFGGATQQAFPRPEDLMHAKEADIRALGYSAKKAQTIGEIAEAFRERPDEFARLETMENEAVTRFLVTLRGVGRWSAQYVLLRGFGRLDIFPGDDVGAQNNLQKLFHLKTRPDYTLIDRLTLPWQPYRGMIYFHLLLRKLRQTGVL